VYARFFKDAEEKLEAQVLYEEAELHELAEETPEIPISIPNSKISKKNTGWM
jgi:hypothetical protein